jgi:hypothetical protein
MMYYLICKNRKNHHDNHCNNSKKSNGIFVKQLMDGEAILLLYQRSDVINNVCELSSSGQRSNQNI